MGAEGEAEGRQTVLDCTGLPRANRGLAGPPESARRYQQVCGGPDFGWVSTCEGLVRKDEGALGGRKGPSRGDCGEGCRAVSSFLFEGRTCTARVQAAKAQDSALPVRSLGPQEALSTWWVGGQLDGSGGCPRSVPVPLTYCPAFVTDSGEYRGHLQGGGPRQTVGTGATLTLSVSWESHRPRHATPQKHGSGPRPVFHGHDSRVFAAHL